MKVSCVKHGRVVVMLETREEIAWLRATILAAPAPGGAAGLVGELVGAAARAPQAPRVRAMTITLETSAEIAQLRAAVARACEPLADALSATVATVAAWGPRTHRWVTPPPRESVAATPARRLALGPWWRRLRGWGMPGNAP